MNFQTVGWGGLNRVDLTRDRDRWRALVNFVLNSGSIKFGEFLEQVRNC
jgi:hypothetical protein